MEKSRSKSDAFLTIWVTIMSAFPDYVLSNVIIFLTDALGMSGITAAAVVNSYDSFTGVCGILGAILADAYLSQYGMIFVSSLFYFAGLAILTVESYRVQRSDNLTMITVKWIVGFGLFLVAIGKFSLMNSANALYGEGTQPKNSTRLVEYAIKFILLILSIALSNIFDNIAVSLVSFLIPAISMFLVTVVASFYLRTSSFVKPTKDRQNPLKAHFRVCIAAFIKRRSPSPSSPDEHQRTEHTNCLRFLDNAAASVNGDGDVERERKSRWFCTVTEVEESKRLLRVVPICTSFLAYGMIQSIGNTFFLDQGNDMDATIKTTNIPLQAFVLLSEVVGSSSRRVYKALISKKLTGSGKKYGPALEYAMGMALLPICCSVASWVGVEVLFRTTLVSVFWLAPQFILFGAMDGLAGEGMQEFFRDQLPPSMKTYDTAYSEGITRAGNFLAISLVLGTKGATSWFSYEKYRLDRFYHLCTVVGVILFFSYTLFAARYRFLDSAGYLFLGDNDNAGAEEEEGKEEEITELVEEPSSDFIQDATVGIELENILHEVLTTILPRPASDLIQPAM